MFIEITGRQLIVKTKSNIDTSYADTGVRVDAGGLFAIERLYRETGVIYESQFMALTEAMKSGEELNVILGYWPTWPMTQAYEAEISLTQFNTAYSAWQSCNKML